MDFKDTQTAENLMRGYVGECQAHARYIFFGRVAGRDKLKEIETLFFTTAEEELAHAKIYYDLLLQEIGVCKFAVDSSYPIELGNTVENLRFAKLAEHEEYSSMYPKFGKIAKDEGFNKISDHFYMIAEIEQTHTKRFERLEERMEENSLFHRENEVYYRCMHCGHVHKDNDAPEICPNCFHPQGFFKIVPYPSI
ncbi:hypothetical protein AN639_08800 [Candidatus Epulonipiscium fishelsonii]|uniref:Uncharacterized protein n=1 Tax=Candidatus Epulonipiscium fishelsonii TaxID=77094 RepID=A0ACC8XF84_9FIRM|nr:hypothetical protein AN639_08800 [Epulopiscium sp. SCG-B05WGA-EpuloA1]ONI41945.1 hypothetical protein AN396_02590 [Epulopiscium sp. SCG-B11WGA-EpuloA1]ONI47555.1 hypothetical protein AN644_04820 [Epulopiscium sp. SCG-C06WGA-EpuloA1]